jgi:hypothetical protein
MDKLLKSLSTSIVLLLMAQQTFGMELFKYVNEDGVTVLDSRIPPEYAKYGYTVISSDGRVLEVVERALTEEELIERDRLAAIEAKKQKEREEKEAADATLMQLYSRPEEVNQARDSKLATINGFITSTRINLQRLVAQKRQLDAIAADIERNGGTVSQQDIDRIQVAAERIKQKEKDIEEKLEEIEQVKNSFARDLIRVKELYGVTDTDSAEATQ